MTIVRNIPQILTSLGLGLAVAASPFVASAQVGLKPAQAVAREAESRGGKNEARDDKGGKRGGDDQPGAHSQNGKNR